MPFLTRWFGVTMSDAERDLGAEKAWVEEIVKSSLEMQAAAAAKQHRSLCRGTHAKGVLARALFEVFDVAGGRDPALAARLARGIFKTPGVYPATVRFGNSDPHVNSDFKPDVRSLSFSVDLTCDGTVTPADGVTRQDFSMQNATTLPINDARAFQATMKVLTASNPAAGLWPLAFGDKLRVLRTLALAALQEYQPVRPYQKLRYWSNVPYRHGSDEAVKQSMTPAPGNPAQGLVPNNPDAMRDELARHLDEDAAMSSFDFALQLLDADKMTYWGKRRDASFWIENASVEWKEAESPFHAVGRLTFVPKSRLSPAEVEAAYIDVTDNASPDSIPIGSINRARCPAEIASRRARMGVASKPSA
jgi:hypothetical protein